MADKQTEDQKKVAKRKESTLNQINKALEEIEQSMPSLSDEQIGFVRARRSYLSAEQKIVFKSLLVEKKEIESK